MVERSSCGSQWLTYASSPSSGGCFCRGSNIDVGEYRGHDIASIVGGGSWTGGGAFVWIDRTWGEHELQNQPGRRAWAAKPASRAGMLPGWSHRCRFRKRLRQAFFERQAWKYCFAEFRQQINMSLWVCRVVECQHLVGVGMDNQFSVLRVFAWSAAAVATSPDNS